ncbi:PAS domain-containing protein [Methylobacterium symbioticum]|nr:PAS domain-containing protein [Methylobacterium symbioticum]
MSGVLVKSAAFNPDPGSELQIGLWSVRFATNEQVWSPGLFRMLGLNPETTRPSYGLFLSLIHPEDRQGLEPQLLVQGVSSLFRTVRVILPDGAIRTLSLRIEVHLGIDARPIGLRGIALDVSDKESLARFQEIERQRREALYRTSQITTFSLDLDLRYEFPDSVSEVHGLDHDEICLDPFLMVIPEERERFRVHAWETDSRRLNFQGLVHERLTNGDIRHFRIVAAAVWGLEGTYLGRTGLKYPVEKPERAQVSDRLRIALEQSVQGHHLRAARALLDWSMAALAGASGLSLSTVRRLEEDGAPQSDRSRHRAIEALRAGGVRFLSMDDGTVAVARA